MPSPVERAVQTYIRACSDRDPAARAALLEECFAADGRLVTRSREIRGRAAVAEMLTRFYADPDVVRIRMLSVVDTGRTTFRFHSAAELRDGTSLESFDAGGIDGDGRISVILTFSGPLGKSA